MAKRGRKKKHQEPAPPKPTHVALPAEYIWDEEKHGERPTHWRRRPPPVPCAKCDAVQNVHASQAVMCYGIQGDVAHLVCRVCGHKWKMPVVDS